MVLLTISGPGCLRSALGILMPPALHPVSAEKRAAVKHDCEILVQLARKVFRHELGYDESSIKWLASLVEFSRNKPNEEVKNSLVTQIGCFLGEAIIERYGGDWVITEAGLLGVRLPSQTVAFPFDKVRKQFKNGATDSIWGFFKMAEVLHAKDSQPGASPNGGPAGALGNSDTAGGSPSVS